MNMPTAGGDIKLLVYAGSSHSHAFTPAELRILLQKMSSLLQHERSCQPLEVLDLKHFRTYRFPHQMVTRCRLQTDELPFVFVINNN